MLEENQQTVYRQFLRSFDGTMTRREITKSTKLTDNQVRTALRRLKAINKIALIPGSHLYKEV